MNGEKPLLEARPSWWSFFWHLLFLWLLIPLIVALWRRAGLAFRVFEDRVVLERGVLSKDFKEIFISDIRSIDVRQRFLQRIVGIGDLMIATAGTDRYEHVALGLPKPRSIKDLIQSRRRKDANVGRGQGAGSPRDSELGIRD